MKMSVARAATLVAVASFVTGCEVIPREHILMFNKDGAPVDPADESWYGEYPTLLEPGDDDYAREPGRRYDAYLDALFTSIESWAAESPEHRRVVVFVHGGLNNQDRSIERAIEMSPLMLEQGVYPIFVNWRSNLLSCYADHLFFVRQGGEVFVGPHDVLDDAFDALGVLWSPFQFAGDAARGILRLPIVATYQIEETTEWLGWSRSPERDAADAARELTYRVDDGPAPIPIPIVDGTDVDSSSTFFEEAFGLLRWIVFAAPKLVSTIAVDTAGTGSWDVMRRRVALLFHREDEFFGDLAHREARGLLRAMQRLARMQEAVERREGGELRISLVGHSMGAIVIDHLLEHATLQRRLALGFDARHWTESDPEPPVPLPRFDDIVYLGAACSVREYERAVFPYMFEDRTARMFHVVLHPENEVGEAPAWDLAPRGSLLTWIDDFLAKPTTPLDRTAGRYTNLLPALRDTPPDLMGRVHLRILDWNDDGLPQAHGEFDDVLDDWRFWSEECWFPRDQARNIEH